MNRRCFAIAALTSTVAAVVGCDDKSPSHTATLLNNPGVQEAMRAVEDAIDSLESHTDDFDDENWREVVPDVKSAADDVRDAFMRLQSELGISA